MMPKCNNMQYYILYLHDSTNRRLKDTLLQEKNALEMNTSITHKVSMLTEKSNKNNGFSSKS